MPLSYVLKHIAEVRGVARRVEDDQVRVSALQHLNRIFHRRPHDCLEAVAGKLEAIREEYATSSQCLHGATRHQGQNSLPERLAMQNGSLNELEQVRRYYAEEC